MIKTIPEKHMSKEESYVERRQLFKHIWDTAMHIDDKEDIMNKPKVIKTLRMDEIDKTPIGKTKKQRIKNLRHVCNRILDFCDRQDADDKIYEQVATDGTGSPVKSIMRRKVKYRIKKKVRNAKSLSVPQTNLTVARFSVPEKNDNPQNSTPQRSKRKIVKNKSTVATKKPVKLKTSKGISSKTDDFPRETAAVKKTKVVKKKSVKKKTKTTKRSSATSDKRRIQIISV